MVIQTRKDLGAYFYKTLLKKDELEKDEEKISIKPKTYVIESNTKPDIFIRNKWQFKKTNDNDLFVLRDTNNNEFFLDVMDKRFWFIHSLSYAQDADESICSLIEKNVSKLDFIWLTSGLLQKIGNFGRQTSFSLKFVNQFLIDEEKEIEQVSMRFWGGPARQIMQDLQSNDNIKHATSLSSLGLDYGPSKGRSIKDDISSMGKFTVIKGNSIESHFSLISRVKNIYSDLLMQIEKNYRISYSKKGNKLDMNGDFLFLEFSEPLQNIEMFINFLTSSVCPFRIWGLWDKIDKDYIKANCVDMHSGDKLHLELTPDWMRIYLDKNACGNVITRIFTNLQRYFDSQIKLYGAEDEQIM